MLKKPPGAQLGFNIRGGKASQLGIFISKVCVGVFSLVFGMAFYSKFILAVLHAKFLVFEIFHIVIFNLCVYV